MKNKISIIGLGVLGLAVAAVSGLATMQFANYGQQMLASVMNQQKMVPSYGDPWQERYRLSNCVLMQEKNNGTGKTLEKIKTVKCDQLKQELAGQRTGNYFLQTTYYDALMHVLGYFYAPDFTVLTPIVIDNGGYRCDYDGQGWKTVFSVMPYGRIGMNPSTTVTEPEAKTFGVGSDALVIVEEQKGRITIPHDFNACPITGKFEGKGVSGGEVRINWGFVSQKIMNMLVIQPNSANYYDASGKKFKNLPKGDYTLTFPDLYKDVKFNITVSNV